MTAERLPIPSEVLATRAVAIVRGGNAEHVMPACETLIRAGVVCLEVTTNTPGWAEVVSELSSREGVLAGVGTVLTPEHVAQAAETGGRFVVAPDTSLPVGEAARDAGLGWYPGALSATEIVTAWRAGATAVKVFPAGSVGGASYLKAVRAPLDDIPLMPTGGIGIDDAAGYLAAGAVAIGIGSPLIGDALRGGSLDALAERAERLVAAVTADE